MWNDIKSKGNQHFSAGRYTEAIVEYTRAIRLDSKQPVLYSNRAVAELRLKMFSEARQDVEKAIDLSINLSSEQRVKHFRILSEALLGLGLLEQALSVCRRGLELDSREETLLLRARHLKSMLLHNEFDSINFREDPQVTAFKKGRVKLSEVIEAFDRIKLISPPNKEILEITDLDELKRLQTLVKQNAEAHSWFYGTSGKQVDRKKALEIFEETAKKGSAEGIYNVALFYSKGFGVVTIDYYKMIDLFRQAAALKPFVRLPDGVVTKNLGVAEAEHGLGLAFKTGTGVDIDPARASEHFLRAARLGLPHAMNNVAMALCQEDQGLPKNLEMARQWFRQAADQDVPQAQFNLAQMLEKGEGGPVDEHAALDYYNRAARHGTLGALANAQRLAVLIGDRSSFNKLQSTFLANLAEKDPETLFIMGVCHIWDSDEHEFSYRCLKTAAEQRHEQATHALIDLLLDILKKNEEAFQWCSQAAERGDVFSQIKLVELLAFGHGCQRDEELARVTTKRLLAGCSVQGLDVEERIKIGRELCEWEAENKLSSRGMTIDERERRFASRNGEVDLEKTVSIEEILDRIMARRPLTLRSLDFMPELASRASQGSVTAAKMIKGIKQSELAIELIDIGENEKAMQLLRKSHTNCGKFIYSDPFKISSALDKCKPHDADAMLVKALLDHQSYPNRIRFVERCIRQHPNDADFYYILACLYGFAIEFQKGLTTIEKAIKLDPRNKSWIYVKGSFLSRTLPQNGSNRVRRIDQAIDCYEEYLDQNPEDDQKVPEAYFSIAYMYSLKKQITKCKLYWDKAVEADRRRLPCFDTVEDSFNPKRRARAFLDTACKNFCAQCQKTDPSFKCACLQERYCSRDCQLAHWLIHKKICQARK